MAVFMIILTIYLLISLGTLLARENIEGTFLFFQIRYADAVRWSLDQGVKPFLYSYKFLYFGEIPIISYFEQKFPIIPIKSGNVKKIF